MDGDLVYLGGGLYANAAQAPAKPPPAPKRTARMLPGGVRPGKARVSGGAAQNGRGASLPPLERERDEYGFFVETPKSEAPAAPLPAKATGPPAWKPAGSSKRPPLPAPEPTSKRSPSPQGEFTGQMPLQMPEPSGPPGSHTEARTVEREAYRREGLSLFGKQGVLREIAQIQMPMQMPAREKLTGKPSNGELRAAERNARKEARTQAILEERSEYNRLQSEGQGLRRSRLCSGSVSAPVLPAAGACSLSMGSERPPPLAPEEMERQKLRVACKMETLAFLNGYHNAMGKMTMEQKASLLEQLHQGRSKAAKPRSAPGTPAPEEEESEQFHQDPPSTSPAGNPNFSTVHEESELQHEEVDEDGWPVVRQSSSPMSPDAEPSLQERLQRVSDNCNQAFDFEAIDLETDAFEL